MGRRKLPRVVNPGPTSRDLADGSDVHMSRRAQASRASGTHKTPVRRHGVSSVRVTIADAREATLPDRRPGWEGYCPRCAGRVFAPRRTPAGS